MSASRRRHCWLVYSADAERSRDPAGRNETSTGTHTLQPTRRAFTSSILLSSAESSHAVAYIACAPLPPPVKSDAMLGSLLTAVQRSAWKTQAASSTTQTAGPRRHSCNYERTRMGVRRDERCATCPRPPKAEQSAARRKRTRAPSEHFSFFLSLAKKRFKDDGMQTAVDAICTCAPYDRILY
jgi:hypothetical protein